MPSTQRNLIVFHRGSSDFGYQQILNEYNWKLYFTHDFADAKETLSKYQFLIGLCLIDCADDEAFLEQLKKLFTYNSQILWVMGLPKEAMEKCSQFRKEHEFIAHYCHDYLLLPVSSERLLFSLGHAYGMAEIRSSPYKGAIDFPNYDGIIGDSVAMRTLFKKIEKVCQEDCSVLIAGETGTGKELIANAIHKHSCRARKPLIALNCGAFP